MALSPSIENLEDSSLINAAVFYSITSTQKGLQGIELGKYLIKNAVQDLQAEHPNLSMYSTLSPIPGFREWLLTCLAQVSATAKLFAYFLSHKLCGGRPTREDERKAYLKGRVNPSWSCSHVEWSKSCCRRHEKTDLVRSRPRNWKQSLRKRMRTKPWR